MSSAPRRRRRPSWTVGQVAAVRALRDRYPRWGKAKLAILLRRGGVVLSVSMVGRILTRSAARASCASRCYTIRRRMRMPFQVRAISVDGGSEFVAEFEEGCRDRGIALFVLPPRSPKLHGSVERANRTHTEEFYEVTDADFRPEASRADLLAWERTYNTIRPHQALGYLTPAEFLASVGVDV